MSGFTYGGAASPAGATYGGPSGATYGTDIPPPVDTSWLIGRSRVDGVLAPHPTITIGETSTFDAVIKADGGLSNHRYRYEQLRDRLAYASDTVTTGRTYDGTPWFRERHDRESLVVKIEPGRDTPATRGVWGIIERGADRTTLPDVAAQLSIDVFVLAEADEYPSREAVIDDLGR